MRKIAKFLAGVALMLSGFFAAAALAQNAPAAGEPPPQPDPGATMQSQCISDSEGFKLFRKTPVYAIELANKCEERLKCRVYVYIISAKGPEQGRATITLAPKSRGAAAKQSYVLKLKMLGGITQSTRECEVE
jgi:hypothetical protein